MTLCTRWAALGDGECQPGPLRGESPGALSSHDLPLADPRRMALSRLVVVAGHAAQILGVLRPCLFVAIWLASAAAMVGMLLQWCSTIESALTLWSWSAVP